MDKKQSIGTVILLFGIVIVLALGSILMPKKQISETENRYLEILPSFTAASLLDGSLCGKMTDYVSDHILFRDYWLDGASVIETEVLQKVERKEILLGQNGRMFAKTFGSSSVDKKQLEKNISAVFQFAQRFGDRVKFILVPSANLIYAEQVPGEAPQVNEAEILDWAFGELSGSCDVIDLREAFYESQENLFYRTDHHWTTDGAGLAYRVFCEEQGTEAIMPDEELRREVTDFYGTHYQSARWIGSSADTLVYYDLPNELTVYQIEGELQFTPVGAKPLVNKEKLTHVDKYGAFLDGNDGYVEISGSGSGKILVIKDSYANCFVPFLVENYEMIGVMDLRNYPYSPDSIISEKNYNEILVLYSFHNFCSDNHLVFLNRPSTLQ